MKWEDFAGNAAAKEMLSGYVDSGRLPHALLIEGPAGSGRRTVARRLAQAAVCLSDGEKPCGACAGCRKALAGAHPDILETGGSGGARSLHADTIRSIREQAYVLPNEAPRRVMILTGAQDMTETAQNALLKVLEEPPEHVLFLLTCENRSQMLSTVQSRALCVSLAGVEEEEGWPVICRRMPQTQPEQARRALRLFGGLIGRAMEGLQEGSLTQVVERTEEMARAVTAADELPLVRLTAGLDKSLWDGVLHGLQLAARDALVAGVGAAGERSPSPGAVKSLSGCCTRQQLMALLDVTEELLQCRRRHMNPTLFSVVAAARLRQAAGK